MSDPKLYVWYWELSDDQHTSFCQYLDIPVANSPFTNIGGKWYILQEGHNDIGADLLDWDDLDGEEGPNYYIADRWSISMVPSIMWP